MSLIVEDGSCVPNADSYISVAEADSYMDAMGMTTWAAMQPVDKERCLRRATRFMVARYRLRWKGAKVKYEQSLDWPRIGVNPDDTSNMVRPGYGYQYELSYTSFPKEVRQCCADLALKAAAGPLAEDATQKVIQETVGPITTKYDTNSSQLVRYSEVDMILAPLLGASGGSNMVRLVRC